jgi:hypothetical protein
MKNRSKVLAGLILAVTLSACNNFFHELIPPDDNLILSFEVDGQTEKAVILDNMVLAPVEKGTDIHSVTPCITVSKKASLLPITLDYVKAAFPSADITETAIQMSKSSDITNSVMELIKNNPDFNVPEINIPIDFTGPVTMLVVSGQGNIRQYTVNVYEDSGEARLLNLRFSKYDNPELINDSLCLFNGFYIAANALYPAEMLSELSFSLVPSFEILGDKVEIDGNEIISGVTAVQFSKTFNSLQLKSIKITRDGEIKNYTLAIIFSEDPDSIRSITDFRFNKADNPDIAANAVALIINTDNTGKISIQVFYTGAKPAYLIPRFISPGNVSVGGVTQYNGSSAHDFSYPFEYKVVSRNGLYVRVYTVSVEFISVTESIPRITSFRFSSALNYELVKNADGSISDGLIMIDAQYGGLTAPVSLVPDFTADGIVKVSGSTQVSGASAQNFTRQIKYTVINPVYTDLTRDYWVQCRMIRDMSSYAAITTFGFYTDENTNLNENLFSKIDQQTGNITIYAPFGSGISARTMIPRFDADGQVSIAGTPQVSGLSGRIFDIPVTYTVVSPNGVNRREYTVYVREIRSTIFVNKNAAGSNDGTTWKDAFVNLKDACDMASQFPEDMPKEIWIAAGTYKRGSGSDDFFLLSANTSYIGGFAGWEDFKGQRNAASYETIITGETIRNGSQYENSLFHSGYYYENTFIRNTVLNGDIAFEDISMNYLNFSLDVNYTPCAIFANYVGSDFSSLQNKYNIRITRVKTEYCDIYLYNAGGDILLEDTSIKHSGFYGLYIRCIIGNIGEKVTLRRCTSEGNIGQDDKMYSDIFISQYNSITISESIIKNTGKYGGLRIQSSGSTEITNCLFENCTSSSAAGALMFGGRDELNTLTVKDTRFINCTGTRALSLVGYYVPTPAAVFIRCEFTHNAPIKFVTNAEDSNSDYAFSMFSRGNNYFENCTFNNLTAANTGAEEAYIFSRGQTPGFVWEYPYYLVLKNCTFRFKSDVKLGIANIYGGDNYLLMDGNIIENFNGSQPLFSFGSSSYLPIAGSSPDVFEFRTNNRYNGSILSSKQEITGLGGSIIRLEGGTDINIVP